MITVGEEVLPILRQIAVVCCVNLPFDFLEDTLMMLQASVARLTLKSAGLIEETFNILFSKVVQTAIPETNKSDIEVGIIRVHT